MQCISKRNVYSFVVNRYIIASVVFILTLENRIANMIQFLYAQFGVV